MQGILELDIVLGSGVGHGTPDFCVPERDSQSSVAGPPIAVLVWPEKEAAKNRRFAVRSIRFLTDVHPHRGSIW